MLTERLSTVKTGLIGASPSRTICIHAHTQVQASPFFFRPVIARNARAGVRRKVITVCDVGGALTGSET